MSHNFDLHRLRLLRELKHRGTITAVATAMSYSHSAVSQQLAVLEDELGAQLLEPDGRRVRLTVQGEVLVQHEVTRRAGAGPLRAWPPGPRRKSVS